MVVNIWLQHYIHIRFYSTSHNELRYALLILKVSLFSTNSFSIHFEMFYLLFYLNCLQKVAGDSQSPVIDCCKISSAWTGERQWTGDDGLETVARKDFFSAGRNLKQDQMRERKREGREGGTGSNGNNNRILTIYDAVECHCCW